MILMYWGHKDSQAAKLNCVEDILVVFAMRAWQLFCKVPKT